MGKSARALGWEFGKTAQEMNLLLKEYGYLEGEPGAYGLSEKGQRFGSEQYNDNGYGGYAHRGWETRTWNDDLEEALRADMAAHPDGLPTATPQLVEAGAESTTATKLPPATDSETLSSLPNSEEPYEVVYDGEPNDTAVDGKTLLIAGGIVVGAVLVWRFGPRVWRNHVKPTVEKVRTKFSRSKPVEVEGEAEEPTE